MVLIQKEGMKGYGAYWFLLETLRCQPKMSASLSIIPAIARRARVTAGYMLRVVERYELFVVADGLFCSPGLDRRMKRFVQVQERLALNESIGNGVLGNVNSGDNSLMHSFDMDDNARIEEKSIKENSNRNEKGEVAAAQRSPIAPIRPWESLTDDMAADTFWMELVGMRSGLGQLYIDHRDEIVDLFRQHIRLYDKGGGLLRLQDVKQYFANYLAAGSRTCQGVRDRLLGSIRQRQTDAGVSPYETIVDGRRTYLGRIIPDSAPPRPDEFSVWDEDKEKWTR